MTSLQFPEDSRECQISMPRGQDLKKARAALCNTHPVTLARRAYCNSETQKGPKMEALFINV